MNNIAIIDIEASGLHFESYPIEIALLTNNKLHSWLIKPEPNWTHWSDDAEALHGLSRERLNKEGLPAWQVVRQLNEITAGIDGVLYSDAVYWDTDWLDTLYYAVKETRWFHLASVYELLSKDQINRFQEQKTALSEAGRLKPHRAENDVKIIAEALISINN